MENKKKYIFDNPQNVKRILYLLYACCTILFLLDFVIHRHVVHSWENLWGFYPIYGFVGCVILVVVATWMRTFLMRSEDYYESNDDNTNNKKSSDMNEENHRKLGDHNVDA
ncbi:MAG: hypothetical protein OQL19_14150 [Gammaproteobacteria bacterium]|nr:hypothetical protein [Gammaproteobacteria bacterium]